MTISERIKTARRERRLPARAAWRLKQAERERTWALVSARAEGISTRTLAAAIGLSPSRVHQLLAAADLDALDAALGELRAAGWPALEHPDSGEDTELGDRDDIADRLSDEAGCGSARTGLRTWMLTATRRRSGRKAADQELVGDRTARYLNGARSAENPVPESVVSAAPGWPVAECKGRRLKPHPTELEPTACAGKRVQTPWPRAVFAVPPQLGLARMVALGMLGADVLVGRAGWYVQLPFGRGQGISYL